MKNWNKFIRRLFLLTVLITMPISLFSQNKNEKKLKRKLQFNEITSCEIDYDGNIIVKKDSLIGVLDKNLNLKIPIRYKEIEQLEKNLFLVKRDSLSYLYQTIYSSKLKKELTPLMEDVTLISDNSNHKIILSIIYNKIYSCEGKLLNKDTDIEYNYFYTNNALLAHKKENEYYLVDFEFKRLTSNYEYIEYIHSEPLTYCAWDKVSGKKRLINDKGVLLSDDMYDYIDYSGDYIEVAKNDKYGLLSPFSGNTILPVDYDSIEHVFCDGNADFLTCKNKNEWSLIDIDEGTGYFTVKAKNIEKLYSTSLFKYVDEDDKCNLLNEKGEKVLSIDYDDINICFYYYGYCEIIKDNKYGMVDGEGNILVPVEYDSIDFFDFPENPIMELIQGTKVFALDLKEVKEKYFDKKLELEIQ